MPWKMPKNGKSEMKMHLSIRKGDALPSNTLVLKQHKISPFLIIDKWNRNGQEAIWLI